MKIFHLNWLAWNNKQNFVGKLSSLGIIYLREFCFRQKSKKIVLWRLYLMYPSRRKSPLLGSYKEVWNKFEKYSKVAWQEHLKYRKYIFASSGNLLTRKEKVKNIRNGYWQRKLLLYNQKFRSWNFSTVKRETLKVLQERLTKILSSV